MKRSQLKQIVKEIVRRTFQEMGQQPSTSENAVDDWELSSNTSAIFYGVKLPDGRKVNLTIEFTGQWDDGAFNHAFGTHRYANQYNIEASNTVLATNEQGQKIPLDAMIIAAGENIFNSYEQKIVDAISDNPPDSGPDPDAQRDRDIDRELGL